MSFTEDQILHSEISIFSCNRLRISLSFQIMHLNLLCNSLEQYQAPTNSKMASTRASLVAFQVQRLVILESVLEAQALQASWSRAPTRFYWEAWWLMKFRIIQLVGNIDYHKFSCLVLLAVKLMLWRVYQVQLQHKQLLTNRIQTYIFKNFFTTRVNLWISMTQADPITSRQVSPERTCMPMDKTVLKNTRQAYHQAITNLQWKVLSKLPKESNKSKLTFFINF